MHCNQLATVEDTKDIWVCIVSKQVYTSIKQKLNYENLPDETKI